MTKKLDVELTAETGRLIYQEQIDIPAGTSSLQINTKGIAKGIYFLGISNSQARTVRKVIIQ